MNMNICPRVFKLWFQSLFISLCLLSAASTIQAQSRWSNSAQVNNPIVNLSSGQFSPVIARDGEDGAIIVWVDNRSGNFDLYGIRIDVAGDLKWDEGGTPLITAVNSQESPAMTESENGDIFVAWQDNRLSSSFKEIFVQRFNIDGEPIWLQEARAHTGNNGPPRIILENLGNLITASFTTGFFNQAALSGQILDAGTGNTQFKPDPRIFDIQSQALNADQAPAVAAGLSGGILAAWADSRGDTTLQAIGMLNNGDLWNAGQLTISNDIKPETFPVIVSDGSEGAIIVWIESVVGSDDDLIRATRLNSDGGNLWSPGIQEISTSNGEKRNLRIASDGADGAFIIWENLVQGNWQIYSQRIFTDGQNWNSDTPVSIVSSNQSNARLINNRKNDAVLVWEDDRNLGSGIDLFAQRISSTGARLWEEIAVSMALGAQQKPVLTDDGFGGAIIAWEDLRNGNPDIFAQRVSPTGVLGEFRTITVSAPAPGENWEIGSQRAVRWSASPEIDSVKIELSRNGGQSFETVVEKVANANPQDNSFTLTVAGGAASNCLVRITAQKANFIVDMSDAFLISAAQGPTLSPLQIQDATAGQNLVVQADASDISGVQSVQLNYKFGGARSFTAANMQATEPGKFSGTIPAAAVTERGVEYFIRATDGIGTPSNTDTFFVNVNFNAGRQTKAVNGGSSQNSYRMFSSPNLLDQTAAAEILLNSTFGAYDTTSWRLFHFRSNAYVEFDTLINANTFVFTPGQAYWLISARDRTIDFGAGNSRRSDQQVNVVLPTGWSQLGNPFAFPVAWNDIMAVSGNPNVAGPFLYDGSFAVVTVLEPYAGYFVLNRTTATPVTLRFPPLEAPLAAEVAAKDPAEGLQWEIQIHAECQEARDHFNLLGIHSQAAQDWDRLDYPEPPPVGEFVSVYFPQTDWKVYPDNYTTDFRKEIGAGQTWNLNVRTNIAGAEARLRLAGLEPVPQNLEIWLVDEKLNVKQDIRSDNQFVFATGDHGTTKSLKLIIGTGEFLADELADQSFIPKDFELSQNFPNPFNPATAIRYGLPKASKVTLKIYDVLGREVITLIDNENKQPGFHLVTWNGKDKNGNAVASGLYVYRIAADTFVKSHKMMLVK